jgi:hypothetical protein
MFFFHFILFNQFNVCVYFYYHLIEKKIIKKISKNNQVNIPSCKIKYLNLHLSLNFSSFIFIYCLWLFFHLLTHIIIDLFDYMYA